MLDNRSKAFQQIKLHYLIILLSKKLQDKDNLIKIQKIICYDITSTSIDPIAKYLCCWTNIISQAEIIAIQERTKQRHPNLICFLFFQDVGDKYAQSKEFKIYYEYLALDVKQLIEKRQQNKDYVPEDEICKMISGLSDSLLFLQNKGISNSALTLEVQDVSPFRAKAPNLFYNQFQPPENGKNQKFNRFKYDVFGLGMIILSLALLKDCEELYNQGILQVDKLEENLLRIGKLYPGRVENVLRLMVDLDNVKRPDWIEFQQILKQNKEKQIRLLEQQSNISQLKTIRLDYQNSSSLILISKQVIRNVKQVPMLIIIIKKIQKQRIIVRREMVQIKNQLI
ncbi:unnamed protein product [Paramecium sonneborni]|uniref:Protein kinase domain-containing protein n=1 Tax=Paramecium sonneborni TaxID=65129 RepID=A0A8S1NBT8_9CILI|nr:unnamed protein product [Paramecium sonneborni]